MTLVPTTQAEALLVQERDAAIARAETAERALREALVEHAHQLLALDTTIATERADRSRAEEKFTRRESDFAVLVEELAEASRRLHAGNVVLAGERTLRAAAEQRCTALGSALDRAEAELARMRGIASKLEDEVIETSMVAEAIVAAPVERDARIEHALIELLDIAEAGARRGGLTPSERARVRTLRGLVPS